MTPEQHAEISAKLAEVKLTLSTVLESLDVIEVAIGPSPLVPDTSGLSDSFKDGF